MKLLNRKDKLSILQAVANGKTDALRRYKHDIPSQCFMVVSLNGTPKPTDLVDTSLPDEQGCKRVTYAEFLSNPAKYGYRCITVD